VVEAKEYLSETPEIPEISHPRVDPNIVYLKKPWDSDAIALTTYKNQIHQHLKANSFKPSKSNMYYI